MHRQGRIFEMLRHVVVALGFLATLGGTALAIAIWRGDESFGIARVWERLAGPADQGAVDFGAISRSPSGNDALICPPGLCGSARVDAVSPVFAATANQLRDAVRLIDTNNEDISLVFADAGGQQDRFLARTRLMRYPDTINVRFLDVGEGRATLALYSRSQIGRSDLGVNRARLESWITQLRGKLPAQP